MTCIDMSISPKCAEAGVAVRLGVIETDVSIGAENAELGQALDEAAARRASELEGGGAGDVMEIATTRKAYKALGKDPSRYRPSAEALIRRVLQGKGLFRVNSVVDVNNLLSIETGFCAGAYDVTGLEPTIVLRPGNPGETYEAIGRGPLNLEGLPLLTDQAGAFGSPTSDSERTMIRPETASVLLVIYGFGENLPIERAVEFACEKLKAYCNAGEIATRIVE